MITYLRVKRNSEQLGLVCKKKQISSFPEGYEGVVSNYS